MTPPAPLRILLVEDDLVDRLALRRAAGRWVGASPVLLEAETGEEGLAIVAREELDCILLDYQLPDVNGLEFIARLQEAAHAGRAVPPVMMLTGDDSAAVAAEAMRRGARDYLVKDGEGHYLERLPAAVERMLREQRLIADKHQVEARFRTLVEQIQAITYMAALGERGTLLYISPQIRALGFTPDEWMADPGRHLAQVHPEEREEVGAVLRASRAQGIPLDLEYRLLTRDGQVRWVRDQAEVVYDKAGAPLHMQGILVDISAGKQAEAALRQSQDELRRLAAHQEKIKEHERKRIAQEIHDELGGLLTGIKAYISVAIERASQSGGAADPLLVDTSDLAQSAIETVRRVITDLRPSVLDQLGIWAALEWYAQQVQQRTGLRCSCRIDPRLRSLELDAERSTMLFRIAQEALTNVARHAAATEASVQVEPHEAGLCLTVHDNGKGIDTEDLLDRESWGILGMHERSRRFDGELTIKGRPGQGTTLQLRLPTVSDHEQ